LLIKNLLLIAAIIIITFLLFHTLPEDPARLILGLNVSEDAVKLFRQELGLDKPILTKFVDYIQDLFTLNLGTSYYTRSSVTSEILNAFYSTQLYAGIALVLSIIYSIFSVYLVYITGPFIQKLFNSVNGFLVSIPSLIITLFFGLLIYNLKVFNEINDITLQQIISASIALSIYPSCVLSQILIAEFELIKNKQFVIASKVHGFVGKDLFRIIFSNSFLPWISQLSNIAASLIAGSIIIEYIFSLPGLGRLIFQSIIKHDYPVIQGIVLFTSIGYIIFNLVIEMIYNQLLVSRRTQ